MCPFLFSLISEGFLSDLLLSLVKAPGGWRWGSIAYSVWQTHVPLTPGPPRRNAPVTGRTPGADGLAPGPCHSGGTWSCVRQAREPSSRAKPGTSQTAPRGADTGKRALPIDPNAGPPQKTDQGEAERTQNPTSPQRFARRLAPKPTSGPPPAGSTRRQPRDRNPPPRQVVRPRKSRIHAFPRKRPSAKSH